MAKQTLTAFYDSREYAENAALLLRQAGVAAADIQVSPGAESLGAAPTSGHEAKGFWASLEEMFGGSADHATYTEGLRRGGVMLVAHVADDLVDDAVDILEQHGSIDLDERETTWRGEGWTGASAVTGGGIASGGTSSLRSSTPVYDRAASATTAGLEAPMAAGRTSPGTQAASTAKRAGDDVVQVVEETLNVGKRAVSRGKVRLHAYVVEKPVSEDVSLHRESVSIERRPVNRPLGAADLGADAFKERTIEMQETAEEAVVAKSVRVVEEIGIRKDVQDNVQRITDTVRSTKVDIDDSRVATGTEAGSTSNLTTRLTGGMAVIGSDGQHVGVIDHVDGSTIKLKKDDPASGGRHHLIPVAWVASVDGNVVLKTSAADVMDRWTAA